jgi:hypothetical protein
MCFIIATNVINTVVRNSVHLSIISIRLATANNEYHKLMSSMRHKYDSLDAIVMK